MDQCAKQHLFYFHAILMYAGLRGGCIHPDSDKLTSYVAWIEVSFLLSYIFMVMSQHLVLFAGICSGLLLCC